MTTIRKINVSQIEGDNADKNNINEIRPFGEIAVYLDNNNKLTLMMFDGVRTHQTSKILSPGVFYGSNADAGDGSTADTIKLIPDAALGSDQYIVVDPTGGEPGHIHLRAGGIQDQSSADLYLGGEETFVRVSDTYDNVVIRTSTPGEGSIPLSWTFDNGGDLSVPNYINFKDGSFIGDEGGAVPPIFKIVAAGGQGIQLTADSGEANSNHTWLFGDDGSVTFPGSSNARIGDDEPGLVVYSENGFAVQTNANNVNNYEVECTGYVSNGFGDSAGATLTVTEIVAGTITDGMTIYGSGLPLEGWVVTFGGGVMEPQGSGGTGNYLLSGANILTSSQSFNNGVAAAGSQSWIFEVDGTLRFPDATVQTTAWDPNNTDWADIIGTAIQANGLPVGTRFTQPVPLTSKGADGDTAGAVAFDGTHIYYCIESYSDGVADIWKRVAWSVDTW